MDAPEFDPVEDPRIGLCSDCQYARVIIHPRGGSPYYRCLRAEHDPRFEKFPAVPVRRCDGYQRENAAD